MTEMPTFESLGLRAMVLVPDGGKWISLVSTASKAYADAKRNAELLIRGRVLAIDPSIGSESSQPGYAVFEAGRLTDCGVIDGRTNGSRHSRLFAIGRSLREDFADVRPDVLVIEQVPVARFSMRGKRKFMNPAAQVALHRATGAVQSNVAASACIEVSPQTWHRFTDPLVYRKSDTADAIAMGFAVLCMAHHALETPPKKRRTKKETAK